MIPKKYRLKSNAAFNATYRVNNSHRKNGITLILISHSLAVVSNLCENIAVMQKGRLLEYGNTDNVLSNPKTEYTKNLLAASSYTLMKK